MKNTDYEIAKAIIEKALMRDDIIEGEFIVDENAKMAYIKAGVILSMLKSEGYLDDFLMDPVEIPTEDHSVGIYWSDKSEDMILDSEMIVKLCQCFEKVNIDKSAWFMYTTIYRKPY